jgi:PTH1 family peptidyl-tRNA hydrolase
MRLVVGLRNPGSRYEGNRHNVGAGAVAAAADLFHGRFRRARLGMRADVCEVRRGEARAVLALPRTFMNESGDAVSPLLRYFHVDLEDLLIVHDDIDLPFAKLRVQHGRGSGGNRGITSVIRSLRTEAFWRLKLGVGRPPGGMDPADFVLRPFTAAEAPEVEFMIGDAADVIERFIEVGGEAARQLAGERNPGSEGEDA